MWTKKKKLYYIFYKMTASWLPETRHLPLGGKLRVFWIKRIIRHCGKNVNIERGADLTPDVSIGDNSGIGIRCQIYGSVSIGSNVLMGPEVVVYTQNHKFEDADKFIIDQGYKEEQNVLIGDDVWIGRRVMIMPGSRIGNGCVVAAGAIVKKNIPYYAVVGGVPAKIIKYRGK